MDRHPFGPVASVFNFNRRVVAPTSVSVRDVRLVAPSYDEDGFGLTRSELAQIECDMFVEVNMLLFVFVNAKSQTG